MNKLFIFVTKLSTTGSFLMVGNTTLLIGTEDEKVDRIKAILRDLCPTRKQLNPSTSSFGRGMCDNSLGDEVQVGGATMFVLGVEDFEKI